jgi:uncharacterized protein YndB with AHSA1/START domain
MTNGSSHRNIPSRTPLLKLSSEPADTGLSGAALFLAEKETMEKEIRLTVRVNATMEVVWDALTNPAKIEQYMYGAIARTDWQPGSPIHYYFSQNGQETLVVKGEVIKAEAPRYLEHTLFPTTWQLADVPENYLTVAYQLTSTGDSTDLTVIQQGFSTVAEGEKRYNDALNGWSDILPKIVAVAEGKS